MSQSGCDHESDYEENDSHPEENKSQHEESEPEPIDVCYLWMEWCTFFNKYTNVIKAIKAMIKESPIDIVTRTQLFVATYTSKDRSCPFPAVKPSLDEIKRLVSLDPYLGNKDLDNDAVANVDGKGRVRGLGTGVIKTVIHVAAPYKKIAEEEKRKCEITDENVRLVMRTMMAREAALMEDNDYEWKEINIKKSSSDGKNTETPSQSPAPPPKFALKAGVNLDENKKTYCGKGVEDKESILIDD
ncbi:hypothetical protein IFM89_037130 [Coptis chinensis]|uniref:Uncharacterized protein n=1 Tax=Coptis chinensis TaxID=261450 RepID=A0A835M3A7_9MAGN|nr:hypothetical protein IFM89_037130 [Coptis chinensis]